MQQIVNLSYNSLILFLYKENYLYYIASVMLN